MPEPPSPPPPRRGHLVEYAAEAWALGLFMIVACGFGVLLFHPASPVVERIPQLPLRRVLMGAAMGLTAIGNIYSPWGRRSGAHMNPAATLAFLRLGKVAPRDAAGYIAAQFAGGLAGVLLAASVLDGWLSDPSVNFVVTRPGRWGVAPAFLAEAAMAFGLMTIVLALIARPRLAPFAGVVSGALVMLYIAVEEPVSGMSINPARTLGSALPARYTADLWLYFAAPVLGMLAAAALFRRRAPRAAHCAKLHHDPAYRCIFCEHQESRGR